ncbi:hypothetical protein [Moorena sp. SIO4G3]|nr:hypothetical protein [Moorena sp. SIO4G3]
MSLLIVLIISQGKKTILLVRVHACRETRPGSHRIFTSGTFR